jgi:hypothetical protein
LRVGGNTAGCNDVNSYRRKYGILHVRHSGEQALQQSGKQEVRRCATTAFRDNGNTRHRLSGLPQMRVHIAVVSPFAKGPAHDLLGRDDGKTDCRVYGFTALRRGA